MSSTAQCTRGRSTRTLRHSTPLASSCAVMPCLISKILQHPTLSSVPNTCESLDSNKPAAVLPRRHHLLQVRLRQRHPRFTLAFTLLELLVVLGIVAVVVAISFPLSSQLQSHAQRVQCSANLRSLYIATELSVQQNGSWPQIDEGDDDDDASADFGIGWIGALKEFGVSEKTWICPTVQNLLGNPDISKPENARVDYVATPFDDKPTTPHEWPRQPWFAEVGNVHRHGNLIIFTDGSISDLDTIVKKQSAK
jgi:type II secretory pathway pseudopilin PulG